MISGVAAPLAGSVAAGRAKRCATACHSFHSLAGARIPSPPVGASSHPPPHGSGMSGGWEELPVGFVAQGRPSRAFPFTGGSP
jgi:hypothetical protein